jgi:hypothetical protein
MRSISASPRALGLAMPPSVGWYRLRVGRGPQLPVARKGVDAMTALDNARTSLLVGRDARAIKRGVDVSAGCSSIATSWRNPNRRDDSNDHEQTCSERDLIY